jgi:hypothetical protein
MTTQSPLASVPAKSRKRSKSTTKRSASPTSGPSPHPPKTKDSPSSQNYYAGLDNTIKVAKEDSDSDSDSDSCDAIGIANAVKPAINSHSETYLGADDKSNADDSTSDSSSSQSNMSEDSCNTSEFVFPNDMSQATCAQYRQLQFFVESNHPDKLQEYFSLLRRSLAEKSDPAAFEETITGWSNSFL